MFGLKTPSMRLLRKRNKRLKMYGLMINGKQTAINQKTQSGFMSQIKMIMNKAINSDKVQFIKSLLADKSKIVDLFLENSWIVAILDNGLRVKIRN